MGGVKIIMAAAALAFVALAAVSFAPQEQAPEPAVALDQADQSMPSFYPGWTSEDKENTMHSLMLEAVAKNISGLTAQGLEKLSNSPCSWGIAAAQRHLRTTVAIPKVAAHHMSATAAASREGMHVNVNLLACPLKRKMVADHTAQ